ncbi:MAG TPA: hypothetical protein VI793_04170 [Anaerolineales bacterium]|nr:hypothetical protein [Anaerolineales bacterium]
MELVQAYRQHSVKTADNLRTIAQSQLVRDVSRLSLPQIDAVVELVAQVIPAGNVPGAILSGLTRLPDRKPPLPNIKRDIHLLFRGVEQVLDQAVYGAFFAGPAAVIWGYQNLLKLAGKDPEDSFPEGTWQFYVDYALREDTARHANETHGFDTLLRQHQIHLSPVDRLTAWVMAAIHCLHQYHDLLANEWRERVTTALLRDVTRDEPEGARYAKLYGEWEKQRPYGRGPDAAAHDTYPTYRRRKFHDFLEGATRDLDEGLRRQWLDQVRTAEAQDLPAYQRQMSILAYLDPGPYGETRTPIPLSQAHIGVIYRGSYSLIPACVPGTEQPADVTTVRAQVAALVVAPPTVPTAPLTSLVQVKRTALAGLRDKLNQGLIAELDKLRLAPILLNGDPRPRQSPLSELRQAERGVGDHALTIFGTGESIVLDQAHIFFDGAWGAALAEILTNEALSWAVYLHQLAPAQPGTARARALSLKFQTSELDLIQQAPRVTPEAGAETDAVNVKAILALRKLFKRRSDLLQLTVNDLLILYRAIHAATYQPKPDLVAAVQQLAQDSTTRQAALAAQEAIADARRVNPAILIPVDASQRSPRDRLYPMSFEVPLADLDLLNLHAQTLEALNAYQNAAGDRTALYARFDQLQRTYLAALAGFGAVMGKAKEIALLGESASVGTIKLLAHLPTPLQRLLDTIPGRFDLLNDIIKGREVFSNVGAVAPTSTLTRFITAKDDNEKKTLAWGAITDAQGVLRLSLRDFRPHVGLLEAAGQKALATRLAQDYLDAYANGLNDFVRDLRRLTLASRETRLAKRELTDER